MFDKQLTLNFRYRVEYNWRSLSVTPGDKLRIVPISRDTTTTTNNEQQTNKQTNKQTKNKIKTIKYLLNRFTNKEIIIEHNLYNKLHYTCILIGCYL